MILARVQELLPGEYHEANDHQHHGPVEHGGLQDEVSGLRAVHLQGAQPNGVGSVSYTHLDVYKRQVYEGIFVPNPYSP